MLWYTVMCCCTQSTITPEASRVMYSRCSSQWLGTVILTVPTTDTGSMLPVVSTMSTHAPGAQMYLGTSTTVCDIGYS